ncbi:hypothetical protein [Edaphobacter bradus]|uniref:hypothetical protein n=1 Tax=Edaphobacter bradus TaxID=2259016 RepID=UPI0021E0733F|nr:hypothetical protein [Edaphobacter bradus]
MRKLIRIASPLLAVALVSSSPVLAIAQTNQAAQNVQDWNTPPAGTEQAQQGYRDGIEAAKLDRAAKRKIDAKSSHLYLHPPVKGAAREAYRDSFVNGYEAAVKHSDNPGM